MVAEPVLPDYSGACVANIVPALVQHAEVGRGWIPDEVLAAKRHLLLVIDGLGANQLSDRMGLAPVMASLANATITTVAPTTTATALTSIATGSAPGEHGVVGYKMSVGGEVLNVLRWSGGQGSLIDRIDPAEVQPLSPFFGTRPTVISEAKFAGSGFTLAHLRDTKYVGYDLPSAVGVEAREAFDGGAELVYAYYDGIDQVAHVKGLGAHYDAELGFVDRLVGDIIESLPAGTGLIITADHGQVHVGDSVREISPQVKELTTQISGEARFVWLRAASGRAEALADAAISEYGDMAWVRTLEQILDEQWFGHDVSAAARARLGDVAIVVRADAALVEDRSKSPNLIGRHGSMTPDEVLVPLLTMST